jgi:hypothetical protein
MGKWCPVHQVVHGHEAFLIHEELERLLKVFDQLRVPNQYLENMFEDTPKTDSGLLLPVPPGRNGDGCLWGHVCHKHDLIHGMEARLVREHLPLLMHMTPKTGGVVCYDIRRMYKVIVPPADTIAWLEENWGRNPQEKE